MNSLRRAIIAELRADSELRRLATGVHFGKVSDGSPPPYIIVFKQSGVPDWCFDGPPLDGDVWLVKGVGEAGLAEDIDTRCQAVLNDAPLRVEGRNLLYLKRMSDVTLDESTDGERFFHIGSLYRVFSEASS